MDTAIDHTEEDVHQTTDSAVPLMAHFATQLPKANMGQSIKMGDPTPFDSGGTTGAGPYGEDANIDWD